MALSQKAITIFAAVEVLRDSQADIRYALATLFEPDLATFDGQLFDPGAVADRINSQYHLGITGDVLQGFIAIFQEKGWIQPILANDNEAYIVKCKPSGEVTSELERFRESASEIAVQFRNFITEISPLAQVDKSDEELIDDLVGWLMLLDRAGQDDIATAATTYRVGKRIVFEAPTHDGANSEATFLSARFVEHLFSIGSPFRKFLVELAEVGLVTEVVRDFQKPASRTEKTDLSIYLDAPLALDYLGLSGMPQQRSVAQILKAFSDIGGSVRIYRQSINELQQALSALLARPVPSRTGPTADALRRREVFEPFVREVASHPDRFIKDKGIAILEQDLEAFPSEHKYFSRHAYEELYSQIAWVQDDAARHHDAVTATMTMRKRAGRQGSDIFALKHVVVTRNPKFANLSWRIAQENFYIGPTQIGPVIHLRQLATAMWLRVGAAKTEIPRSYILAACRRVLTLRRNIVERVNQFKESLTDAQAEQLEILLSSDRSTQVLMDKTLGAAQIIDSSNIELLLDEMRKAQIADLRLEKEKEIADLRLTSEAEIATVARDLEATRSSVDQEKSRAEALAGKYESVFGRFLERVNRRIRIRRLAWGISLVVLFAAVTWVGFFVSGQSGLSGFAGFLFVLFAGALVQFNGWINRFVLGSMFRRADITAFHSMALDHGFNSDEAIARVTYDGERFIGDSVAD